MRVKDSVDGSEPDPDPSLLETKEENEYEPESSLIPKYLDPVQMEIQRIIFGGDHNSNLQQQQKRKSKSFKSREVTMASDTPTPFHRHPTSHLQHAASSTSISNTFKSDLLVDIHDAIDGMDHEKWKCPSCGNPNAAGHYFCEQCSVVRPELSVTSALPSHMFTENSVIREASTRPLGHHRSITRSVTRTANHREREHSENMVVDSYQKGKVDLNTLRRMGDDIAFMHEINNMKH